MSWKEKAELAGMITGAAVMSPLMYYAGKNERPFDASELHDYRFKDSLVTKRDKDMALEIIKLLEEDEIDDLLVDVGRGHIEGIVSNLEKQVELREAK